MIHFGLLTAILDGWNFEEAVDTAAEMGFECLEVACWPAGKAERRYAGVSHIDAERVLEDDAYAKYVTDYVAGKGMHISSLAYYPNTMDPDLNKRNAAIAHLKALIKASAKLGVNMVTTFIGRDQYKSVEENIELFREIWPPIIKLAEENGVKVAIENCPMLFGKDQWPGGQNLMWTPATMSGRAWTMCRPCTSSRTGSSTSTSRISNSILKNSNRSACWHIRWST